MTYSLLFASAAEADIVESIQWYNSKKESLGFEFYEWVDQKLSHIAQSPLHFPIQFNDIRTARINKFPYLIYFRIDDVQSVVFILGVLHTSRNPTLIKRRI